MDDSILNSITNAPSSSQSIMADQTSTLSSTTGSSANSTETTIMKDLSRGSSSALSDRVTRALGVRTDAPSLLAALDALAGLSALPSKKKTATGEGEGEEKAEDVVTVVDARSVRSAVERDSLERACKFSSFVHSWCLCPLMV